MNREQDAFGRELLDYMPGANRREIIERDARVQSITRLSQRVGIFDTVVMLANNFGLFGNVRRARWMLKRFRQMTSDDATILAESTDPQTNTSPAHRKYQQRNRKNGRMAGQLRLRLRYRQYKTTWFDYLLVSKREMERIVQGTGWVVDEYIDSDEPIYIGVLRKDNNEGI